MFEVDAHQRNEYQNHGEMPLHTLSSAWSQSQEWHVSSGTQERQRPRGLLVGAGKAAAALEGHLAGP